MVSCRVVLCGVGIEFGYPVYSFFGAQGLYAVFFMGGVAAAVPTRLYDAANDAFVESIRNSVTDSFFKVKMKDLPSRFVSAIASLRPTKSCGSSGAVCALMACQGNTQVFYSCD